MASQCDSVLILLATLHHEALQVLSEAAEAPLQGLQQGGRKLRLPNTWQRKLREIETCAAWSRHISPQKVSSVIGELKHVVATSMQTVALEPPENVEQAPHDQVSFKRSESVSDLEKQMNEKMNELSSLQDELHALNKTPLLDPIANDVDMVGEDKLLCTQPKNVSDFLWLLHRVLISGDGNGIPVDGIAEYFQRRTGLQWCIAQFLVYKGEGTEAIVGALSRVPHIFVVQNANSSKPVLVLSKLPHKTTYQDWRVIDDEYKIVLKNKRKQK